MPKTGPGGKAGTGHTHLIPDSLVGPAGPAGSRGPTGSTGATGAAGPNVTILTHTGPPISTDGTFTKGQVAIDSGNVPYICTVAGTPGTWVYLALNFAAGTIGSNVSLGVNTATKVMDTASLAVGIWLVSFSGEGTSSVNGAIEAHIAVNSATATFQGPTASGADDTASAIGVAVKFTCVATVTVAGTLQIIAEGSSGTGSTMLAASRAFSVAGVTGYTAVRIG
jgi:hypothetical protein